MACGGEEDARKSKVQGDAHGSCRAWQQQLEAL